MFSLRILALAAVATVADAQSACDPACVLPTPLCAVPSDTCVKSAQYGGLPCSAIEANPFLPDYKSTCEPPLVCVQSPSDGPVCQPPGTVTPQTCLPTISASESACTNGLFCGGGTPDAKAGACVPGQARGGSCASIAGQPSEDNCVDAGNVCIGHKCQLVSSNGVCFISADASQAILCPIGQECKITNPSGSGYDGVCETSTANLCSASSPCPTGEVCGTNPVVGEPDVCYAGADIGEVCLTDPLGPISHQKHCRGTAVCLATGIGNERKCYMDACYGACGREAECVAGFCQNEAPCQELSSGCCEPSKKAPSSCSQAVIDCVCAFDDPCCNSVSNAEMTSGGWDWQCVDEAITYCGVSCTTLRTE
jgi:hypothetical protein